MPFQNRKYQRMLAHPLCQNLGLPPFVNFFPEPTT